MGMRTGIITGSSVVKHAQGGLPGRVLQVVITDMQDVQDVQTFQAGEEFSPTPGCTVSLAPAGNAYKLAAAVDDGITPLMEPGGKRIYSTDPDGAAEVAEVRLLPTGEVQVFNAHAAITLSADGAATVANGAASFTMGADGTFTFHGTGTHFDHPVTMDSTLHVQGAVTSDVSVTAPTVAGSTDVTFAGKSAANHTHITTTVGQPTSIPQ